MIEGVVDFFQWLWSKAAAAVEVVILLVMGTLFLAVPIRGFLALLAVSTVVWILRDLLLTRGQLITSGQFKVLAVIAFVALLGWQQVTELVFSVVPQSIVDHSSVLLARNNVSAKEARNRAEMFATHRQGRVIVETRYYLASGTNVVLPVGTRVFKRTTPKMTAVMAKSAGLQPEDARGMIYVLVLDDEGRPKPSQEGWVFDNGYITDDGPEDSLGLDGRSNRLPEAEAQAVTYNLAPGEKTEIFMATDQSGESITFTARNVDIARRMYRMCYVGTCKDIVYGLPVAPDRSVGRPFWFEGGPRGSVVQVTKHRLRRG